MDANLLRRDAYWTLRSLVGQIPGDSASYDQGVLGLISETALMYRDQIHKAVERARQERDVEEVFGDA